MFDYTEVSVRVNCEVLRHVKMGRVPLQGSFLPPLFFNVFITTYHESLGSGKRINISKNKISSLIYADDIILMRERMEGGFLLLLFLLLNFKTK